MRAVVRVDGQELSGLTDRELTAFRKRTVGFVSSAVLSAPRSDGGKECAHGGGPGREPGFFRDPRGRGIGRQAEKIPRRAFGRGAAAGLHCPGPWPSGPKCCSPTSLPGLWTSRPVVRSWMSWPGCGRSWALPWSMVTHNQNIAQMADRVITMNSGEILGQAEGGGKVGPSRSGGESMFIRGKDLIKLAAIAVVTCCAVFVCTLFSQLHAGPGRRRGERSPRKPGGSSTRPRCPWGKVVCAVTGRLSGPDLGRAAGLLCQKLRRRARPGAGRPQGPGYVGVADRGSVLGCSA